MLHTQTFPGCQPVSGGTDWCRDLRKPWPITMEIKRIPQDGSRWPLQRKDLWKMQIHCTTTQATGLRNWASTSWRCGDKLPLQLFVLQGLRYQCCGSGTHFIHQLVANIIWHMGGCTACRHLMHQMPRFRHLYFQNGAFPLNQQLKSLAAEEHGITFSTIQGFWRSPDGLSRAPSQRFHIGWHTSWAQPTLPGIPEIQAKRQAMSDRCGSSGLCKEFYSKWILLERINRPARHILPNCLMKVILKPSWWAISWSVRGWWTYPL